jgi:hypothetical protein
MISGVATGDPWVAARFAFVMGIAFMVAAAGGQNRGFGQSRSKHRANFSHGEVPAKEAGFIPGMRASFIVIFG